MRIRIGLKIFSFIEHLNFFLKIIKSFWGKRKILASIVLCLFNTMGATNRLFFGFFFGIT